MRDCHWGRKEVYIIKLIVRILQSSGGNPNTTCGVYFRLNFGHCGMFIEIWLNFMDLWRRTEHMSPFAFFHATGFWCIIPTTLISALFSFCLLYILSFSFPFLFENDNLFLMFILHPQLNKSYHIYNLRY